MVIVRRPYASTSIRPAFAPACRCLAISSPIRVASSQPIATITGPDEISLYAASRCSWMVPAALMKNAVSRYLSVSRAGPPARPAVPTLEPATRRAPTSPAPAPPANAWDVLGAEGTAPAPPVNGRDALDALDAEGTPAPPANTIGRITLGPAVDAKSEDADDIVNGVWEEGRPDGGVDFVAEAATLLGFSGGVSGSYKGTLPTPMSSSSSSDATAGVARRRCPRHVNSPMRELPSPVSVLSLILLAPGSVLTLGS
ncbi:hypothetical protein B0H16DRAFT_1739638 [Mycena metata]|uniref:Uncharacterized protein n=1 Tax=Mycena metata TaxID=1033252 RepID=A0AAD7MIJ7_9AGAR|nr:hypothetical protein B0H16DRAFT_1739638 [Mycena metata]